MGLDGQFATQQWRAGHVGSGSLSPFSASPLVVCLAPETHRKSGHARLAVQCQKTDVYIELYEPRHYERNLQTDAGEVRLKGPEASDADVQRNSITSLNSCANSASCSGVAAPLVASFLRLM